MSKLNRLGAVLFMVALVGVAWGGATKISSFMIEADFIGCPSGDGVDIEMADAADGMAILNYVPGTDT
ncbi:MAG: hypothetical protein IID38_10170, partial [Planctomycetes bacterium]|nr:hypothetical protein [Planctomycetota bacterium]